MKRSVLERVVGFVADEEEDEAFMGRARSRTRGSVAVWEGYVPRK